MYFFCQTHRHRFFPLLKFMLEKCEQATLNPNALKASSTCNSTNFFKKNNSFVSASQTTCFEQELKQFVQENEAVLSNGTGAGNYLDSMLQASPHNQQLQEIFNDLEQTMANAILVLRIHLYEIEKVNELCADFAEKYKETLRIKLNSDNLFKIDDEDEDENEQEQHEEQEEEKRPTRATAKTSHGQQTEVSADTVLSRIKFDVLDLSGGGRRKVSDDENDAEQQQFSEDDLTVKHENSSSFEEDEEELDEEMKCEKNTFNNNEEECENANSSFCSNFSSSTSSRQPVSKENGGAGNQSSAEVAAAAAAGKNKRGILPKKATSFMRRWLFRHLGVRNEIFVSESGFEKLEIRLF